MAAVALSAVSERSVGMCLQTATPARNGAEQLQCPCRDSLFKVRKKTVFEGEFAGRGGNVWRLELVVLSVYDRGQG